MAMVQGAHLLAHGNRMEARRIAADIRQHHRLLVGTTTLYGAGVYAWHPHRMPPYVAVGPHVIFEIDEKAVVEIRYRTTGVSRGFFLIPGAIGEYISVHVLAFVNVW
jgi:hypothetical protein